MEMELQKALAHYYAAHNCFLINWVKLLFMVNVSIVGGSEEGGYVKDHIYREVEMG